MSARLDRERLDRAPPGPARQRPEAWRSEPPAERRRLRPADPDRARIERRAPRPVTREGREPDARGHRDRRGHRPPPRDAPSNSAGPFAAGAAAAATSRTLGLLATTISSAPRRRASRSIASATRHPSCTSSPSSTSEASSTAIRARARSSSASHARCHSRAPTGCRNSHAPSAPRQPAPGPSALPHSPRSPDQLAKHRVGTSLRAVDDKRYRHRPR